MAKGGGGGGKGGSGGGGGKSSGNSKSGGNTSSGRGPGGSMAAAKSSQPSRVSNSQPGRAPNNPKTGQQMSNRQTVGSRVADVMYKAPGSGTNWPGQSSLPQGRLSPITPASPSLADKVVSAVTSPFSRQSQPDASRALSASLGPYRQSAMQAVAGGAPALGNRREQSRFVNENIGDPGLTRMRNPAASLGGYVGQQRVAKDQSRLPQGSAASGLAFNPSGAGPFAIGAGDPASQRYAKVASYMGGIPQQRQPAQMTAGLSLNPFDTGYSQIAARFPSFNTQVGTDALNSFENARMAAAAGQPTPVNIPGGDLPVAGNAQAQTSPRGFFGNMSGMFGGFGLNGNTARNARDSERGNKANGFVPLEENRMMAAASNAPSNPSPLVPAAPRINQYGRYRFPQYTQSWAFSPPDAPGFLLPG